MRNEQNSTDDAAANENAADDADIEMKEITESAEVKVEDKKDVEMTSPKQAPGESEANTNESTPTPSTPAAEVTTKTEEKASAKQPEQQEGTEQSAAEQSSEPIKIEENAQEDDPANIINIDPRTYCKLGHFHLLLEDFPKGKNETSLNHSNPQYFSANLWYACEWKYPDDVCIRTNRQIKKYTLHHEF